MKKYSLTLLTFVLLLTGASCFGQSYAEQLTAFRKSYMNDFLTDSSSPLKKEDLQYLRFYDADSTYRVTATAEMLNNTTPFVMPVFSGGGRQYLRYARISFVLKGKPYTLFVYRSVALAQMAQYKDYLFLPFTDDTNGNTTYEGGRYIDLQAGDFKNNKVIIDFNKAYNPYCAYSGGYSCPKPPDENHLPLAVEAGEKLFDGKVKE